MKLYVDTVEKESTIIAHYQAMVTGQIKLEDMIFACCICFPSEPVSNLLSFIESGCIMEVMN